MEMGKNPMPIPLRTTSLMLSQLWVSRIILGSNPASRQRSMDLMHPAPFLVHDEIFSGEQPQVIRSKPTSLRLQEAVQLVFGGDSEGYLIPERFRKCTRGWSEGKGPL